MRAFLCAGAAATALLFACDRATHTEEAPAKKESPPVDSGGGAAHAGSHPPPAPVPYDAGAAGEGVIFHGTTEQNELPPGSEPVHGIFGFAAPRAIYAVTLSPSTSTESKILFSVGEGTWTAQRHPVGTLTSIWGSAPGDVYAAGLGGIIHSHGDGKWTAQHATHEVLFSIRGSGPLDVWAVGKAGTLLHSKGKGTWSGETGVTTANDLYSVRVAPNGDVYVVGKAGTILHRRAGTWHTEASGTTKALYDVEVSSATDVRAVGEEGVTLTSHGDGKWSADSSLTFEDLDSIFSLGPVDTYAGGDKGALLHWTPSGLARGFSHSTIEGIWGDPSLGVFFVGRRLKTN